MMLFGGPQVGEPGVERDQVCLSKSWMAVSNPCCAEDMGLRFADFELGVADALRPAERLDPTGCPHGCDPSGGVWKLVHLIMEGGQLP
jgi:hypothetical protein